MVGKGKKWHLSKWDSSLSRWKSCVIVGGMKRAEGQKGRRADGQKGGRAEGQNESPLQRI